ncbi:tryptophan synthase alpha chain [Cytobacillus horneckiae]|uniref:Tryptophan synthase alpha chain n=1 Tax=Cytobacillus horneckiae TaxID=549687 RepID=A0A2N0ZLH4_9BACI|nr:tryptophan synthase subunit alpha [Cytobacillus horneckiae]MBN6885784.1 tryptophan synthase subunit alpha [Cytobacillus horneckiae]MCM3177329.1 tryptophan synthase subunit alpha [Cytobacillus horneckiae]MEC1156108.1 tryptophan synthase subunit alpha [Cytobacillus horneckiae]MED2937468.1 tryptophan synthase subunit alpha [Cytobacillus horneckiae]PKG30352.1 tryptophan synthase subunit alpha [Cytobacillus horneckiae]
MNRIEKVFQNLQKNNQKAFVPYIMAGDGGIDSLKEKITFLEKAGATAIEIGIPFSDPVADGPVIQQAGIRALKEGTTLKDVVAAVAEIRPIVHIPLLFMTYTNPMMAYGFEQFIKDIEASGIDGLIVPDMPIEQEELIVPYLEEAHIELIRLVTLQSPLSRIEEIAKRGKGFVYAVTVNGITGARSSFKEELGAHLKKVKELSPIPVLAGFGISFPDQVEEMITYCDGVIVGSKMIELFDKGDLQSIVDLIDASKIRASQL